MRRLGLLFLFTIVFQGSLKLVCLSHIQTIGTKASHCHPKKGEQKNSHKQTHPSKQDCPICQTGLCTQALILPLGENSPIEKDLFDSPRRQIFPPLEELSDYSALLPLRFFTHSLAPPGPKQRAWHAFYSVFII